MATATETEITCICIDNSFRIVDHPIFYAQLKAIEFYCQTKFKCNRENLVGLFPMSIRYHKVFDPTTDLGKIQRTLKGTYCLDKAKFDITLRKALTFLIRSPPNMSKRLLIFVASPLVLFDTVARVLGTQLKQFGVAVDVVNFYVNKPPKPMIVIDHEYRWARDELDILVTNANHNDNSHLFDVADASSVCRLLSDSILKEDLLYLQRKEAGENDNVKQELENKAVADHEPLGVQFGTLQIEPLNNEENTSVADAHAPGVKHCPTKKTSARKNQTKVFKLESWFRYFLGFGYSLGLASLTNRRKGTSGAQGE